MSQDQTEARARLYPAPSATSAPESAPAGLPDECEGPLVQDLRAAISAAAVDERLLARFLSDLLTPRETIDLAQRWRIARSLLEGGHQTEVAGRLSNRKLVQRVALRVEGPLGSGGYREVHQVLGGRQRRPSANTIGKPAVRLSVSSPAQSA